MIPSNPAELVPHLMHQLPKNLESNFLTYAQSENTAVKHIASKGFIYHPVKAKKVLFIGLHHIPEGDPDSPLFGKTIVQANEQTRRFIEKIAKVLEFEDQWTYLDLLYAKLDNPAAAVALLKSGEGISFLVDQVRRSMELIEAIQPKIIFLTDAAAVPFFRSGKSHHGLKWMGYECAYDNRFGAHVIKRLKPDSLVWGHKDTKLLGVPVIFLDNTEPIGPFAFRRFANQIQQIMWVYNHQFGAEYPGNSGNILQAFVDLAADIDEWTRIKNHYVAQMDYYGSVEARDRIHEYFDKIEVVLTKLLR